MKITIFGATGGTGRHLIEQACAAGHDVTAVVRDAARLAPGEHLTVVEADVMDPDAIASSIAGRDAVLTAIGPNGRGPTTVQTDSTTAIIAAMNETGVRRLVCVSNSGMHTDGDGRLTKALVKPLLRRLLRHGFADMRGMEDLVAVSGLDWTVVRPPRLTNGKATGSYRTEVGRNVRGGIQVSRADTAACVLRSLSEPGWVRAAVSVAS
jgi:putative NADH-flavin reductase